MLVGLKRGGVAKCNLFLFGHNGAGRSFWEEQGWIARDDLILMQKPVR